MKKQKTFSQHIIDFTNQLEFKGKLPKGIQIMNPFQENPNIPAIAKAFYTKYYNDHQSRRLILGINPGRLGAGATGIPFTDTKRMSSECGIDIPGLQTHEPSSVFVYDMIHAYGGPAAFYKDFYISSICPLGFITMGDNGKEINYNYYDSVALTKAVTPFMIESMEKQLEFGLERDACYCLGMGKNAKFITELNKKRGWFKEVVPLEHPRYIMQYKLKSKALYIDKYLSAFHR